MSEREEHRLRFALGSWDSDGARGFTVALQRPLPHRHSTLHPRNPTLEKAIAVQRTVGDRRVPVKQGLARDLIPRVPRPQHQTRERETSEREQQRVARHGFTAWT